MPRVHDKVVWKSSQCWIFFKQSRSHWSEAIAPNMYQHQQLQEISSCDCSHSSVKGWWCDWSIVSVERIHRNLDEQEAGWHMGVGLNRELLLIVGGSSFRRLPSRKAHRLPERNSWCYPHFSRYVTTWTWCFQLSKTLILVGDWPGPKTRWVLRDARYCKTRAV